MRTTVLGKSSCKQIIFENKALFICVCPRAHMCTNKNEKIICELKVPHVTILYYDTLWKHHVDKPPKSERANFRVAYVSYTDI